MIHPGMAFDLECYVSAEERDRRMAEWAKDNVGS
jgi:hypothetical protein